MTWGFFVSSMSHDFSSAVCHVTFIKIPSTCIFPDNIYIMASSSFSKLKDGHLLSTFLWTELCIICTTAQRTHVYTVMDEHTYYQKCHNKTNLLQMIHLLQIQTLSEGNRKNKRKSAWTFNSQRHSITTEWEIKLLNEDKHEQSSSDCRHVPMSRRWLQSFSAIAVRCISISVSVRILQ